MPRACVFCEASKPSREHVLPAWISAELPGSGPFRFAQQDKTWLSKDAGKIVKAVCRGCNHGWMSDLEQKAKPLLAPAIRGERVTFSLPEQTTIATWTTKTVLMSELGRIEGPSEFLSRPEHRHLFRHKEPAPGTYVWMAGYQGPRLARIEQHLLDLQGSVERDPGLATTMSIGQLVLQVIQVPTHIQIHSGWQIPRLWPSPEAEVTFPPSPWLSDEGFDELAKTMLSR